MEGAKTHTHTSKQEKRKRRGKDPTRIAPKNNTHEMNWLLAWLFFFWEKKEGDEIEKDVGNKKWFFLCNGWFQAQTKRE